MQKHQPAKRFMEPTRSVFHFILALIWMGCGDAQNTEMPQCVGQESCSPSVQLVFDFADGELEGFDVGQTDFTQETVGGLEFAAELLPGELDGFGLRVTATNLSDDQWHYLARELGPADGITADTMYRATMTVRVASNTPSGCAGVGGSPDSVYLKGGVVAKEPQPLPPAEDYIQFNVDKGNQVQVGSEAFDLGDIGTEGVNCRGENPWVILERSGTMDVESMSDGRLWLYVGGDSGFESTTTLFYDRIELQLEPR